MFGLKPAAKPMSKANGPRKLPFIDILAFFFVGLIAGTPSSLSLSSREATANEESH
jgi:hypothetical protein